MIRAAVSLAVAAPVAAEVPALIRAEMIPVAQCWNVGGLSPVAVLTAVTVAFSLDLDGELGPGSFDLPSEQCDAWKHIEMTFDPRRMEVS